jgi:MoaA/NifB/PqqE/SkfB family radical SAM enzyme
MRAVVKGKLTKDFSVTTVVRNGHDLQRVLKKFRKAGLSEFEITKLTDHEYETDYMRKHSLCHDEALEALVKVVRRVRQLPGSFNADRAAVLGAILACAQESS